MDMGKLMNHYSDWIKLKRAVAWLLRFKTYCRGRYLSQNVTCSTEELTLSEIQTATHVILCYVQENSFKDELKALRAEHPVKKSSCIVSLNPKYEDGLIKTDGRVINHNRILLPSNHHVTRLVIRLYHENLGHTGTQNVLAEIRKKYWIVNGHSSVKKVVTSCFTCRRQQGLPNCQQMAPLLEEQTTPDKPPFTFVGIDYFGPMTVKVGRVHSKRYGCLFTCLTSRAVHIEIAHSLSTDSFLSAFQRFTSRRGTPQKVFSDNGTNLVGGERELKRSIQEWNQSKLNRYMTQKEIDWHFNPPYSSHMGGAWERLIRSIRTILKALVKEQLLNDEQLLTFMAETEKILNDRP